jgi:hypothetical protein
MAEDLLLPDGRHMRQADAAYVFDAVQEGASCSIVAVSNMGKSALLRLLAEPSVHALYLPDSTVDTRFLLVDCNRMLELSEQGFYELLLRCVLDQGSLVDSQPSVLEELRVAYDLLIHPSSAFDIPLSFNRGMTAISRGSGTKLVLLFDEFDQALAGLHGRVFLNLRALKDQYKGRLVYVTATDHRLREIRSQPSFDEFLELFTHHIYYLPPLLTEDVILFARRFAQQEGITFDEADERFIYQWAGGHPGLLEATCRALGRVTGAPERDELQDWVIHREVASWLSDELSVRVECRKIWEDLTELERDVLLEADGLGKVPVQEAQESLRQKHLLHGSAEEPRLFSRLFANYVQRLRATRRPKTRGVQVEVDSGMVYVDGQPTETLTNLEYRLILLLYGRLGQIVSKYDVVEAVWGEEYMDEVDDARIEKLVSRLRNKVEPDPRNPHFLVTVRGRGYRLES